MQSSVALKIPEIIIINIVVVEQSKCLYTHNTREYNDEYYNTEIAGNDA